MIMLTVKIRTVATYFLLGLLTICLLTAASAQANSESWKDDSMRAVLRNSALEASFQGGMLYQLKDLSNGSILLQVDPSDLPAKLPVLGSGTLDLDASEIKQTKSESKLFVRYTSPDGTVWWINWRIEPKKGDLVVNSSIVAKKPVEELRAFFLGADIREHGIVWLHGYGTANKNYAPQQGPICLGNPLKDGTPSRFNHPIVALFEGNGGGWFIEGREPRIGPACLMIAGTGDRVNMGMVRAFPFPKNKAEMYEVRIRTYKGNWADAVDPYVEWLEKGAGIVALDKLPKAQQWINGIKTQAYVGVGNFQGLEELAKRVKPKETFVGRQGEFRDYAFDVGYPDYRVSQLGKKWARRARDLGFHVGMHFNVASCSVIFPDLIERFKPGMQPTGKDDAGNETYEHIYSGSSSLYRVSSALPAWREYLIDQMKDAVDAGIDVIYLDESMVPHGRPVVGDMDSFQGALLLMNEIRKRYPHVAVETEQFNLLTAKYGKFALSQMPVGHPLSGYIFRKFVKVVPEGVMYSPTDSGLMDAFDSWGFMLPGADAQREESWMQIAEAFHKYNLRPDIRLPHKEPDHYAGHYSGGVVPMGKDEIPEAGVKLFGFRGTGGITAYFEKHPTKRGLVVYESGKEPKWFGTRYCGVRSYTGPGVPAYFGYREQIKDWLIYDGDTLLGLDPMQTYWLDPTLRSSPKRFHVCKVPDDFAGVDSMEKRASPQEVGRDDAFFLLRFTGHGELGAYVPEGYDVYLNGRKLDVDAKTRKASLEVSASVNKTEALNYHIALTPDKPYVENLEEAQPAVLMAFRRTDVELKGSWSSLPLYGSADALKWIKKDDSNGFTMSVGTVGRFVGRIPQAKSVRIQGSYLLNEDVTGFPGDGVIRINGAEVLRIPHGVKPYKEMPFDVDISQYAGKYVLVEFTSEGSVRGNTAEWNNPRFVTGE